jgi:hypothetical protein
MFTEIIPHLRKKDNKIKNKSTIGERWHQPPPSPQQNLLDKVKRARADNPIEM